MIELASYVTLATVLTGLAGVTYLARPSLVHDGWRRANERLLLGLPLGTMAIVGVNSLFFLFAQRAYGTDLVLTVPYISWSLTYPLGFLASPVAHASVSHITGNLVAAAVFGPVVEYAVGHRNGRRPVARALVGIPLCLYAVGVVISVLSWGPVIGFSGVLYFLFGFAVVFYPLVSVGLLVVSGAVGTVFSSLRSPVVTQSAGESFTTPGWANIAVDAHVLGLLLGIGAAVLVARRRPGRRIDGFRVGVAVLLLGLVQGVYAVWTVDGSTYRLYRALGVALVGLLSAGLGYGVSVETSAEPLLGLDEYSLRRSVSVSALVAPVLVMAVVGLVAGLGGVSTTGEVGSVEVGDYEVWYGEDVENERALSVPLVEFAPVNFTATGAYVTSDERDVWMRMASRSELRSDPTKEVLLGGLTWSERVVVERIGMTTATGNTTYSVSVTAGNETRWVFNSGAAATGVTVDGWEMSLRTTDGEHNVLMERDSGEVRWAYLDNTTTVVGNVSFDVENDRVVASAGDTTAVLGRTDQTSALNSIR